MLLHVPFAIWLVVWVVMLRDWSGRKDYPSVVASPGANRALWLLALGLLDPLLTLLYWAVVRRGFGQRHAWWLLPVGLLLAVAGWIVALVPGRPEQFERDASPDSYLPRVSISFYGAEQNTSAITRFGRSAFLWPENVEVVIEGRSVWATGFARAAAEQLMRLPFLDRVSVRKLGDGVGTEPDLRLFVGVPYAAWREPFLLSPSSLMPVVSSISVRSPAWFHLSSGPVRPSPELSHECSGESTRLEVGYRDAANRGLAHGRTIHGKLGEAVADCLYEIQCARRLRSTPERCFGVYRPARELSFLARLGARQLATEAGFFVHNRTVWEITMPGWDEYRRVRKELADLGFVTNVHGAQEGSPRTDLRLEAQRVRIEPAIRMPELYRMRDGASEVVPPEIDDVRFYVLFEDRFSEEEQDRIMRRAKAEDRWGFVGTMSDHVPKADFRELVVALDEYPVENPFECIARCHFAQRVKDRVRALRWLRQAQALVAFMARHPGREAFEQRIDDLAKKLEAGEIVEWQRADYVNAGYRDLDSRDVVARLDPGGIVPLVAGSGESLATGAVTARFGANGAILVDLEFEAPGAEVRALASVQHDAQSWRDGAADERKLSLPSGRSLTLRTEVRPDASIQITLR